MNERRFRVIAGGLALALAIAPITALHSQSKPQGTWGTTPGQTNPGTTTTTTTTTGATPGQTTTNPTTTVSQSSQADVRADAAFLKEAAGANLLEVRLGQTAQSKASNSAVKQFGQRMVNDHTNLESQVAALSMNNGLGLKQSLNSQQQSDVNRLNKLSGQAFDTAYMNLMVKDHQEDIGKFQTQSSSAKSTQVRTLATNALPVLQQHLSLATQVRTQLGITDTTNIATSTDTTSTNVGGKQRAGGNANIRSDAEFIRDAGAGNAMFVQLSEIAQNKAKDNAVRQFAERARSDFEKLDNQWSDVASNNAMKTGGMGKRHHQKIETLQKASSNNFDKTYMTIMVQQLHDRLTYWQKEGRDAKSARVRNQVDRDLPTIQQLYAQAQQVSRQVGVNPDAALRNRTDVATSKNDNDKDKNKNK
jgi:putative membrane protein